MCQPAASPSHVDQLQFASENSLQIIKTQLQLLLPFADQFDYPVPDAVYLRSVLHADPNNGLVHLSLGMLHYSTWGNRPSDHYQAAYHLERVVEKEPDNIYALSLLINSIHLAQGDPRAIKERKIQTLLDKASGKITEDDRLLLRSNIIRTTRPVIREKKEGDSVILEFEDKYIQAYNFLLVNRECESNEQAAMRGFLLLHLEEGIKEIGVQILDERSLPADAVSMACHVAKQLMENGQEDNAVTWFAKAVRLANQHNRGVITIVTSILDQTPEYFRKAVADELLNSLKYNTYTYNINTY